MTKYVEPTGFAQRFHKQRVPNQAITNEEGSEDGSAHGYRPEIFISTTCITGATRAARDGQYTAIQCDSQCRIRELVNS